MKNHLTVLDGWRGISILAVLAAHLIPLGPKMWQVNEAAGLFGMSLFFILSGFLITCFLLEKDSVVDFLIRRFFRIIPLAWVGMTVGLLMSDALLKEWVAHYLFFANLPPFPLKDVTAHFWSLCVEMHFYLGISLLVVLLRKHWMYLIPVFLVFVTGNRIFRGEFVSIVTTLRIDEILSGSLLALVYKERMLQGGMKFLGRLNVYVLLVFLFASCFPQAGFLNYARPYFAGAVIGATLANPNSRLPTLLTARVLVYIATVSYALYVIHPLLAYSWLGEGDKFVKYAKRPVLFVTLFVLAHLSTFFFEKRCIAFGRILSEKFSKERS